MNKLCFFQTKLESPITATYTDTKVNFKGILMAMLFSLSQFFLAFFFIKCNCNLKAFQDDYARIYVGHTDSS